MGEVVSSKEQWFLFNENSQCWLQPAVDRADGTPRHIGKRHSSMLSLSADPVQYKNDYGVFSIQVGDGVGRERRGCQPTRL